MIVTTTSGIQGKEIIEYIDIVNGEAIMVQTLSAIYSLLFVMLSVVVLVLMKVSLKKLVISQWAK